jgi:kynureninase
VIYLDGNSLGAQPRASAARAQQVIGAEWGEGLIRSWNTAGWFALPRRLGDKLAPLIGGAAGEGGDTTRSTCSRCWRRAARQAERAAAPRDRVRAPAISRPTCTSRRAGRAAAAATSCVWSTSRRIAAALGDDTAVLMLTHVNYRTGDMHDMAGRHAARARRGRADGWDLAHSAGAVPVDLNGARADYAVGCTYKYLNGGPGSPAFVWVPHRHAPVLAAAVRLVGPPRAVRDAPAYAPARASPLPVRHAADRVDGDGRMRARRVPQTDMQALRASRWR